jgi:hypothetical protein
MILKKISSVLFILIFTSCAYAQEVITSYDNNTISVLNNELRKLRQDINNIQVGNVSASNVTTSYDSGWFAITTNTTYAINHNLGTNKFTASVYSAQDTSGTGMQLESGNIIIIGVTAFGMWLYNINNTTASLRTSTDGWNDVPGVRTQILNGAARVIINIAK